MSDPAPYVAAVSPSAAAPRDRRRRLALTLLLLLSLALAAVFGWQWWLEHGQVDARILAQEQALQRASTQIAALQAQNEEVRTRQADLSRLTDRNGTDIAALQARIDDSLKLMSRISEDLSGGRTRFRLAAIEHLLAIANDQLLLYRDSTTALVALDIAESRLADLSDPQLFPVREAVSREIAALRAVPAVDLSSSALTLGSLIERAPSLPLAAHAPAQFQSPAAREAARSAASQSDGGWDRLVATVRDAASALFTLRQEDIARAMRLLPPEAEATVYQVLTLRLESARAALLRSETAAMRESLRSAASWLDAEFKADDPGVLALRAELDRLQKLELRPPLPDISHGLTALRARLDATHPDR